MVWKNLERWYDFPFPIPLKRSGVQNTERECYRGLQRFYAYYIYSYCLAAVHHFVA